MQTKVGYRYLQLSFTQLTQVIYPYIFYDVCDLYRLLAQEIMGKEIFIQYPQLFWHPCSLFLLRLNF